MSSEVCSDSVSHSVMPCAYFNHGGGPMPLLGQQPTIASALQQYPNTIPTPTAIVVVTAHWVTDTISVSSGDHHPLYFDYGGFPPQTYKYTYDAPGSPELADKIVNLLGEANIPVKKDSRRGWDHGVFVPLMLMFPQAVIPVVALSVHSSLDPELHLRMGQALASLRQEGVLILGSGYTFHNFDYFFASNSRTKSEGLRHSRQFDEYLQDTLTEKTSLTLEERMNRMKLWASAPSARAAHKVGQEEHLIPLHVLAGAGFAFSSIATRIGDPIPDDELAVSSFEWK